MPTYLKTVWYDTNMRIVLFVLIGFFGIGSLALAQVSSDSAADTGESLIVTPQFPEPGEEVRINLNTFTRNTFGAGVTWQVNGQTLQDSSNNREIVITAGEAGSRSIISAILSLPGGGQQVLQTEIKPVYIDIILEPQTRVPEFYPGRALPSVKSSVNATALFDDGKGIQNRSDLIYTWKINRQVIGGGPLRGNNQVSFETTRDDFTGLTVEISSSQGTLIGSKSLSIPRVEPELYFYEVHALHGLNQTASVNSFNLIADSAILRAEPYYLDIRVYNNPDILSWDINNTQAFNPSLNPYEVTIQKVSEVGSVPVNFQVGDRETVLQAAQGSLNITY